MKTKLNQYGATNSLDSQYDLAAKIALFSLLNLTLLPLIAFSYLLVLTYRQTTQPYLTIFEKYQLKFGLAINLIAGFALFGLSLVIFYLESIQPAVRWALIISYFTLFHSLFILTAVWNWSRARMGLPLWRISAKDHS
ncbi:MAG: hypothetical protein COW84_08515 [Gammaproteobacteria bacterium CG22_combo_CG10-13_8_21_14_all_40_8]|nr:MAG: hypothetical protein COW84_08515 [Gammaproteobacteria bacterium CG22_combo_CG10-13_8_21_14_all_40_8]